MSDAQQPPTRMVVLDTETTGLSAEGGDRVIEIACIELLARRRTGEHRHFYLNPDRDSHPDALKVHGLTTAFLSDKPRFEAVAASFLDFIRGAVLVIHNAPFDVGFLNAELRRVKQAPLSEWVDSVVDTLALAKDVFPGKRNSLDALCDRLEVDRSRRHLHGALIDADLLADVYIRLTRGQHALDVAVASERATGQEEVQAEVDLTDWPVHVKRANEAEVAAHRTWVEKMKPKSPALEL